MQFLQLRVVYTTFNKVSMDITWLVAIIIIPIYLYVNYKILCAATNDKDIE